MHKWTNLTLVIVSLVLSGCGLRDRVFGPDEADTSTETKQGTELTGMLLVIEPDRCPIVEGCGPRFSLLGRDLRSQVAIEGDILPEHVNLVLTVVGDANPLPEDLKGKSGYERVSAVVDVSKYRLRTAIPYRPFLVEQATQYTTENYGCDLLWDKSYSWSIVEGTSHLIVRMTDVSGGDSAPWVELTYDGNTGDFISVASRPDSINPCG